MAYSASALLNPKGHKKRMQEDEAKKRAAEFGTSLDGTPSPRPSNSSSINSDDNVNTKAERPMGMGRFIERQYRPEERSAQRPSKRVKRNPSPMPDEENEDEEQQYHQPRKSTVHIHGSTGVWASHQQEMNEKHQDNGPPTNTVDLTNDDDDELEVVPRKPKEGNKEVCCGTIQEASVMAHKVPIPREGVFQGTDKHWPAMKVELRRRIGSSNNNTRISVLDPKNVDFGTIDPRVSQVLAPLMDGSHTSKMRLVSRLAMRLRKPNDIAGSVTSERMRINITIYAPASEVKAIGVRLSQAQIWLKQPILPGEGVTVMNPHEPQNFGPKNGSLLPGQRSGGPDQPKIHQRTTDQIRNDVTQIFDTLKVNYELKELDACSLITTPLLPHQKKALFFLTEREKDNRQPASAGAVDNNVIDITGDGNEPPKNELSLWKETFKRNGNVSWYHAITGHEVTQKPAPVLGGILADVMGLGKTLNMLSLICGSLKEAREFGHDDAERHAKGTLLIAPLSTINNWENQLKEHVSRRALKVLIHHGSARTNDAEDLQHYDLVITTYSVVTADSKQRSSIRPRNPLGELKWFRIVLDEAHSIRQTSTAQSKAVCALDAERRWAVTGTPVQNRLEDLGALIKFLHIEPFTEPSTFAQYIIAPFKIADVEIIPKLRLLVDSITLRRGKDMLNLPKRTERVEWLDMTDNERTLYHFWEKESRKQWNAWTSSTGKNVKRNTHGSVKNVLTAIHRLRRLCAHGAEMLSDRELHEAQGIHQNMPIDLEDDSDAPNMTPREAFEHFRMYCEMNFNYCSIETCKKWISRPSPDDVLESAEDSEDAEGPEGLGVSDGESEAVAQKSAQHKNTLDEDADILGHLTCCRNRHLLCPSCLPAFKAQQLSTAQPDGHAHCTLCPDADLYRLAFFPLRASDLLRDEAALAQRRTNPRLARHTSYYGGPHTKTRWLVDALQTEHALWLSTGPPEGAQPVKSVIFSVWTSHLDLIQLALIDAAIPFARLDGSMTRPARTKTLHAFDTDPSIRCILISIGAGGLGLNLTVASRVYLMEPQWNPAAEDQAIERVHRLGQTRDVVIHKVMMRDSFEGKIAKLQAGKRKLAKMSMERGEIFSEGGAKATLEELKDLFK